MGGGDTSRESQEQNCRLSLLRWREVCVQACGSATRQRARGAARTRGAREVGRAHCCLFLVKAWARWLCDVALES